MFLFPKTTLVKKVMSTQMIVVKQNESLKKAISLMLRNKSNDIFIIDENDKLIGLISLTDISKLNINQCNKELEVKNFMSKDLITVSKDDNLLKCRDTMLKYKIGRLPVVENNSLIGVIREEQVRDYFYMKIEELGEKLNQVINSVHEAITVIDENGKVVIWNKNAEKLYGVLKEEIIGKDMEIFFPNALMLEVLKTHKPIENIYHSPRKDTYVVVSAKPIFLEGKLVGVVSNDKDITQVKQLSYQLEKANDTLKFLENEVRKFSNDNFGNIIGKSEKLMKTIDVARQVAKTSASIFIQGESGTGKEVFARAIHNNSQREGLFVPVNCSAIPSELFESEFFGYEGGAFTGANRKGKMGIFELANKGTVFLDEIGDLPMYMQAKLLRVLQENEIRRVGSEKTVSINVRIISATNKDLKELVRKGEFREDLYYRLNVVQIDLPPLRERKGDIAILINEFLREICIKNNKEIPKLNKNVIDILQKYEWKGNIRELKNTIEHLVVLCKDNIIDEELLPNYIVESVNENKNENEYPLDLNEAVMKIEINTIKRALSMSGGNKAKAAKLLNIPRSTLYYKIDTYKIECQ
ncbi:sigma-54 dependent transcriptional regulator PrdR [Alkalithermobacter paradoxus]|uniref:Transcriptional regulatory protein ZraR n=1 Tax=Alkalithermobacter paradoxus TaxID=29349 RepID=A0A1V4I8S6_9FIRM|nr:transcriptional regulatory protein ZraR [[Clostridium] thermoalcaliphilum]